MAEAHEATSRTFLETHMEEPELCGAAGGLVAIYSRGCPGRKGPNEDGAALASYDAQSMALVVADGVGGWKAGERAAAAAVESVVRSVERAAAEGATLRAGILNGIEQANQEVLEHLPGSAATLAVVEIGPEGARSYHVGDSAIFVIGQRGRIKYQTVDHSLVGFAIEAGLLDEESALRHESRHVVLNVIGDAAMRIEVGPVLPLAARDTVLVASDGLSDNLRVGEIADLIRKGPLERAASRLAAQARLRMTEPQEKHPSKPDDLTFIAFRKTGFRA